MIHTPQELTELTKKVDLVYQLSKLLKKHKPNNDLEHLIFKLDHQIETQLKRYDHLIGKGVMAKRIFHHNLLPGTIEDVITFSLGQPLIKVRYFDHGGWDNYLLKDLTIKDES